MMLATVDLPVVRFWNARLISIRHKQSGETL